MSCDVSPTNSKKAERDVTNDVSAAVLPLNDVSRWNFVVLPSISWYFWIPGPAWSKPMAEIGVISPPQIGLVTRPMTPFPVTLTCTRAVQSNSANGTLGGGVTRTPTMLAKPSMYTRWNKDLFVVIVPAAEPDVLQVNPEEVQPVKLASRSPVVADVHSTWTSELLQLTAVPPMVASVALPPRPRRFDRFGFGRHRR